MLWTQAVVHTTTKGIEPVSGILLMNGINGYSVEDSQDFLEFLENKEVYFDYIEDELLNLKDCETTVTFYVADNAQGFEMLSSIRNDLKRLKETDTEDIFGTLEVTSDKQIKEEDWANSWKKYFKPFAVGKSLCIKPTWENPPCEFEGKTVIEIDPSSSFGTGSHTTTRLCLEEIEKILPSLNGKIEMLDMGCGSGILGIAALKMGVDNIVAVDIDENSARIAKENFELNIADDTKYNVLFGNILNDQEFYDKVCSKKYNLIAANIVADVIIWMAPVFKKVLHENGYLITSGIIAERAKEVTDALEENGLKVVKFTESSDWAAVVLCHDSL